MDIDIILTIVCIAIVGLPVLAGTITSFNDSAEAKRRSIEKEENNQIEEYKALCEEIRKIKEQTKVESDRLISNAKKEAEQIRGQAQKEAEQIRSQAQIEANQVRTQAKKDAAENVTKILKYTTGLSEQTNKSDFQCGTINLSRKTSYRKFLRYCHHEAPVRRT